KQIGLAIHAYHDAQSAIPYSREEDRLTWAWLILPHLEQQALYNLWDTRRLYYAQDPATRLTPVKTYICPTRRSPDSEPRASLSGDEQERDPVFVPGALADYAACAGEPGDNVQYDYHPGQTDPGMLPANGAFWRRGRPLQFKDISDGLSNTLFVGEKHIRD